MTVRSISIGTVILGLMGFGLFHDLDAGALFNVQSLVIVFGGIALVLWIGFPTQRIQQTVAGAKKALREGTTPQADTILALVFDLAKAYRINGPVALERMLPKIRHDFLRFGTALVVHGYDEWGLISALEREAHQRLAERRAQVRLLKTFVRLAPALGMAGTVISLMQVMKDLSHPETATLALGLALSSTLYGVLLGNLVFLPLASKLEELGHSEATENSMVVEALIGLHRLEHPLRIAERLNAYDLYCTRTDKALAAEGHAAPGRRVMTASEPATEGQSS